MIGNRLKYLLLGSAAVASIGTGAEAQDTSTPPPTPASAPSGQDLSQLSIEQLAQVPVRSASKRAEPLAAAPTALYVITNQDIVNSAADSLPEALRLAPNLNVQQLNGHEYAISARGFNSLETANKLLVLIDGRSIYSTLHSGVFWDLHTPMLEDIDQIEVISGPGGTLYGPNAVNGVINITSRDASDTLGGLVRGTAGSFEQSAAARYGFSLGGSGALRIYGNWFNFDDHGRAAIGPDLGDRFHGWNAGLRSDFAGEGDHFTLQGDLFDNRIESLPGDGNEGQNLLGRWTHNLAGNAELQFQAYYDNVDRRYLDTIDSLETVDGQGQINLHTGSHAIVLGAGLRTTRDNFVNNLNGFELDPQSRRLWVYNVLAQDRIALSPTISVTAGIKAERTSFTGLEILPNLRLAWHPDEDTLIWAAASRAVRTPSRIDRQLEFLPLLATSNFQSEKLIAFEAGYRGVPLRHVSLSISAFVNRYDDIRTTEFQPGGQFPIQLMNGLEGWTYGLEAWGAAQLWPWLRLSLGLSTIWKNFHEKPGHADLAGRDELGHDPNLQLFARAEIAPVDRWRLNLGVRRIGALDDSVSEPPIHAYIEADANLTYQLSSALDLFVAGNNLLHDNHIESNDQNRVKLAQRSIVLGTRVRF